VAYYLGHPVYAKNESAHAVLYENLGARI